ncbi:lysophospholipid acyltransferase family protein [Flavihumibacter fluvii]|uniref:lysophospholipid acyltransferase family protein n=1 Tax=Flavihumibacter fluvii TaxID=2838157 RepID=UPI001BDEA9DB|nr:lipid A biosynthesis acyltransferase [Flavihumibacter fluvii]ULQ52338.1 lipid A biosynthesis acyltransferase [Flavihumibacter fluvii]
MYYLVYGFFYLFSLLPMWVMYGISDFVCWLLFGVFGYRREVVYKNLALAFPEKSVQERKAIAKKFEQNFTDTFLETIKLFSASKAWVMKRVSGDLKAIEDLYDKGLRCQVHLGHNFNWELAQIGFSYLSRYTFLGVYMPLKSKAMDRLFIRLRSRSGTILLPANEMRKGLLPYRNTQYLLGLAADQVPGNVHKAMWLNFFGIPSAFTAGPEKGARAGDIPVIFLHITKEKRGHYFMHSKLATEHPANLPAGELTRQYRDFLEKVIRERPDMWLWSHRRWKKSWQPEFSRNWIDNEPPPEKVIHPYETITT